MTDHNPLEQLAARVLDGDDIAWDEAASAPQSQDGDVPASVIRNLRLVDSIARTLRSQASADAGAALQRGLEETVDRLFQPAADVAMPERWGNLELRGELGTGTFATVYRAWDPQLQRECALKLYRSDDPARQQALLEEGRRLARVDHPGIVRVFGAESHDGRTGLWMELVEGPTLDELLQRDGPMNERQAARIGRSLCAALAAVHGAGLVHGDVKAQNVMRRADGRFVLTDFGAGARLDDDGPNDRLQGTPLYLAPELLVGAAPGVATDLYALGVLLYHLVSDAWPVEAADLDELRSAHGSGQRTPLLDRCPGVSQAFCAAIERAISPDPASRFESAGALAAALEPVREDADLPSASQRRLRWPIALGLTLLVVTLVTWWAWPRTEPAAAPGWNWTYGLYRQVGDGAPQPLAAGDTVRLGDRITLEVTADQPLYLYVVNEDDAGNGFVLFPLPDVPPSLPLAPGRLHRLPGGDGNQLAWVVDHAAGLERIHLVASPDPLPEVVRSMASLPAVRPGLPDGFAPRGLGTVAPSDAPAMMPAAAFALAARQSGDADASVQGVQYRVIELRQARP